MREVEVLLFNSATEEEVEDVFFCEEQWGTVAGQEEIRDIVLEEYGEGWGILGSWRPVNG